MIIMLYDIVPVSPETRCSWQFAPLSGQVLAAANSTAILCTIGAVRVSESMKGNAFSSCVFYFPGIDSR